jgi:hypothetical protein
LEFFCFREAVSVDYQIEMLNEGTNSSDSTRPTRLFKVTAVIGSYTAQAVDKVKKMAKQKTAQQLLKQLHPEIKTYGELLDYYEIQKVENNSFVISKFF